MEITESLSEGLRREYTVVVPHADIDRRLTTELERLAATANVPGFRRGKLPLAVARQRWGGDVHPAIMEDLANHAVAQTVDRHNLTPVGAPSVEIVNSGKREDFECKVVLDIFPEIPPLDFGGIALEKPVPVLDDDEIDTLMGSVAKSRTTYHAVDGLAARDGDRVSMEVAGAEPEEGGKPGTVTVTLGEDGEIAPHVSRQLLGAKAGDTISLDRRDPDGPDEKDGSGIIEVRVTEVCEAAVPEVDERLAHALDLPDLAALRDKVREQAERTHGELSWQVLKRELLDRLAERADFQLPQEPLDNEFSLLWERVEAAREGGSLDADDAGKTEDELREEYLALARRRIALALMVVHIARTSGIEVSDEEIARHAPALLPHLAPGADENTLRRILANPEQREHFRRMLLEDKVINYLFEKVTTTERPVTLEALRKEVADGN